MFTSFYNFGVSILPLPLPLPLLPGLVGNSLAFTVLALHVTFFFFLFLDNRSFINFAFSLVLCSFFLVTLSASLIFSDFQDWLTGDSQTASFLGLLIFHPSEFAPGHGTKLFLRSILHHHLNESALLPSLIF